MHDTAAAHLKKWIGRISAIPGLVLDVGSADINGSTRQILECAGWEYLGLDVQLGPNVDCVLIDPYSFPLADDSFDLAVSVSTFEHIEFFWLTFREMVRVVCPGGHLIVIAPSRGREHLFPVDCWRFYPGAMRALAKWGDVQCLHADTDWQGLGHYHDRRPGLTPESGWGDTVGVFRKADRVWTN